MRTQHHFPLKIWVLSLLVIVTNVGGNYLLSIGVHGIQHNSGAWLLPYFQQPALLVGVVLLILWLLFRLALLSATDMSFVLPVTAGAAYVLTSLVGQFWLKEPVSAMHNLGLSILAGGVVVLGTGRMKPSKEPTQKKGLL